MDVQLASGLGTAANQYNTTAFTPVYTNGIRLEITSKAAASTGILEWKVRAQNQ